MCWLLSNSWMLIIGITAVSAKVLFCWKRFVPLIVGFWYPLMILPYIVFGSIINLAGPYSAFAFALLGVVVYRSGEEQKEYFANIELA